MVYHLIEGFIPYLIYDDDLENRLEVTALQSLGIVNKVSLVTIKAPTVRKEFPETWIWESIQKPNDGLVTNSFFISLKDCW